MGVPVNVVPSSTIVAFPVSRKRGRLNKTVQLGGEAGSSFRQPSMLNPLLQVV